MYTHMYIGLHTHTCIHISLIYTDISQTVLFKSLSMPNTILAEHPDLNYNGIGCRPIVRLYLPLNTSAATLYLSLAVFMSHQTDLNTKGISYRSIYAARNNNIKDL